MRREQAGPFLASGGQVRVTVDSFLETDASGCTNVAARIEGRLRHSLVRFPNTPRVSVALQWSAEQRVLRIVAPEGLDTEYDPDRPQRLRHRDRQLAFGRSEDVPVRPISVACIARTPETITSLLWVAPGIEDLRPTAAAVDGDATATVSSSAGTCRSTCLRTLRRRRRWSPTRSGGDGW